MPWTIDLDELLNFDDILDWFIDLYVSESMYIEIFEQGIKDDVVMKKRVKH